MMSSTKFAYQAAAAGGATHIGLIVIVYDALAADLMHCSQAITAADIAKRCAKAKHALSLIAHLESWVELLGDLGLQASLVSFYAVLRSKIMKCQAELDAKGFEELAYLVWETRGTWQQKEQRATMQVSSGLSTDRAEATPVRLSFEV